MGAARSSWRTLKKSAARTILVPLRWKSGSSHGAGVQAANYAVWVERACATATDCLDLGKLHCPRPDALHMPEVFGALGRTGAPGKIRHYGVSVEKVEEASEGDRFPRRTDHPDHLQRLPAPAGELFFRAGEETAGRIWPRSLASGF